MPGSSASLQLQARARALGEPSRHAIFEHVRLAGRPVGVAELAELVGLHPNAVRQHLAKLREAGLLVERVAPSGGPGRPPLVYEPAEADYGLWGSSGAYERLAVLLTEVVETGDSPEEVGRRAGRAWRGDGTTADELAAFMDRQGFEPEVKGKRRVEVVLHACPFQAAVERSPDVVCALHLGLALGMADGSDVHVDELVAKDPRRAGCRVRLAPGRPEDAPPARLVRRR